jgi:L-seryl-tRNA(Ser) seleniumtransferase
VGDKKKPTLAQKIAFNLRLQEPPIVGRISENILLLDPRTVPPEEDEVVIKGLRKAVVGIIA